MPRTLDPERELMLRRSPLLLVALLTVGLASLPPRMRAQDEPAAEKPKAKEKEKEKEQAKPKEAEDEKRVVTRHEVRIGEKVLKYTATAGLLPLRDDEGKL